MLCQNCNNELAADVKFCPYCGTATVQKRFCTNCKTELMAGASFCHECGTKYDAAPIAAVPVKAKGVTQKGSLDLADLSPILSHEKDYCLKYNSGWLMMAPCHHDNVKRYIFVNEDTGEEQIVNTPTIENLETWEECLGFNNLGIWVRADRRIIVYDLNGEEIYSANLNIDEISEFGNIGLSGEELFFYGYTPDVYVDSLQSVNVCTGATKVWFTLAKDSHTSLYSAPLSKDKIAFELYTSPDGSETDGWYIIDRNSGSITFLNKNRLKECPEQPETAIQYIFLDKGTMWTKPTKEEKQKYNIDYGTLVERSIGVPEEMPMKRTTDGDAWYFDGDIKYTGNSYWEIKRVDINTGEEALLESGDSHGVSCSFIVTDKHILVNYDACSLAMLPKRFSNFKGYAKNNPEAKFPFGDEDIRL